MRSASVLLLIGAQSGAAPAAPAAAVRKVHKSCAG